jgi:hypothetical protein
VIEIFVLPVPRELESFAPTLGLTIGSEGPFYSLIPQTARSQDGAWAFLRTLKPPRIALCPIQETSGQLRTKICHAFILNLFSPQGLSFVPKAKSGVALLRHLKREQGTSLFSPHGERYEAMSQDIPL